MLEMVRSGMAGVQGCVSFHGVLTSFPQPMPDGTLIDSRPHQPNSYTTDIKLLVENGANDHLVVRTERAVRTRRPLRYHNALVML